jgi:diguanylate cyclase (GGDEF)-like protein
VEYELQRQRLFLHPVFLFIAYSLLLALTAGLLASTGWHRHTLLIFLLPLLLAAGSHPRHLYLGMAALLALTVAWLTWFNFGDSLTTLLTLLWMLVIGVGLGELVLLLNKHWRRSASELRSNQRFLSLLNDVTHTVLEETEQKSMLQTLADRLGHLFHADGCFITFYNEEQRAILPAAAYGPLRDSYPHFKAVSEGPTLTQSVLDAGEVLVIKDVFNTPYLHPDIARQFSARSAIALPLIAAGRKLGAALITYNTPHRFIARELERARMVAGQISLTVYKGQLLESERRQRQLADALREAGSALGQSLNQDEILDHSLEQVGKILPCDTAVIMLVEGERTRVARLRGYERLGEQLALAAAAFTFEIASTPNLQHMYTHRMPLIIADTEVDPRWVHIKAVAEPHRSWVGAPVVAHGEVLAFYSLMKAEPHFYHPEQAEALMTFAGQVGLALQNARLYEQAQRQKREIETMFRASTTVTAEIELEKVLTLILEQLERVVPYDSAAVFLAEGEMLEILAVGGEADRTKLIGLKVPAHNPLFLKISESKQPLVIQDAQADSRFMGWGGTHYVRGWMGLPLIVGDKIIGELTVDSHQVSAFTEQDARLVMAFARETAIAIRHAQLYQQAVQTAQRLSILYEANREFTAAHEPRELYQAIHRAAERIMPTESFVISVLDAGEREIEVVYMVDNHGASPPQRIPAGQGLSGYIISTGESVNIKNTQEDMQIPVLQSGDPNPILSFLAVPMRRQDGTVFGMVSAQSYQPDAYSAADMEVLELLASQASIALENTRLFAELQTLAITDPLTGLYNRRYFFSIAHREFDRSRRYGYPLSIIMLDIDHFKQVNDRYGHGVGDAVLREAAQRCLRSVREVDLLARYGGEEFVALVIETGPAQAKLVAERFRLAIADEPFTVNGVSVSITASIGVSSLGDDCDDLDCLLMRADQALYAAKEAGRDLVQLR